MSMPVRTSSPASPQRAAAWLAALAVVQAGWLAGCATGPPAGTGGAGPRTVWPDRDGPEPNPPKDLAQVPDAEPRDESVRTGGPNRPYEVLGRRYAPFTQDRSWVERGLASWYGRKFHGKRTASGEVYDMYAMTAAHPTMPLPSYARVRNPANGREVVVRVNDRGPFHPGRIIDLSYTAALKLDLLKGVAPVQVERITQEAIRSGSWKRDAPPDARGTTAVAAVAARPPAPPPVEAPSVGPGVSPFPAGAAATADPGEPLAIAAQPTEVAEPAAVARPRSDDGKPGVLAANAAPSRGFWVQLGAFQQRDGAESFQRRVEAELDGLAERLAVFNDAALFRLQAGPYASRDEARSAAERIRSALQLVPVVLERR